MDKVTLITTEPEHGYRVGDIVCISPGRPSWWRLFSLWRWWKNPTRGEKFKVTTSTETTLYLSSDGAGSDGRG